MLTPFQYLKKENWENKHQYNNKSLASYSSTGHLWPRFHLRRYVAAGNVGVVPGVTDLAAHHIVAVVRLWHMVAGIHTDLHDATTNSTTRDCPTCIQIPRNRAHLVLQRVKLAFWVLPCQINVCQTLCDISSQPWGQSFQASHLWCRSTGSRCLRCKCHSIPDSDPVV